MCFFLFLLPDQSCNCNAFMLVHPHLNTQSTFCCHFHRSQSLAIWRKLVGFSFSDRQVAIFPPSENEAVLLMLIVIKEQRKALSIKSAAWIMTDAKDCNFPSSLLLPGEHKQTYQSRSRSWRAKIEWNAHKGQLLFLPWWNPFERWPI
jgi:hypothetical protein